MQVQLFYHFDVQSTKILNHQHKLKTDFKFGIVECAIEDHSNLVEFARWGCFHLYWVLCLVSDTGHLSIVMLLEHS